MAVVEFNQEKFRRLYPKFTDEQTYSEELLSMYFDMAVSLIGNTDAESFAPYDPDNKIYLREILLYLAICHLITLDENQSGSTHGRIASASQGSVSTSFDLWRTGSFTGDWWSQTPCGQRFWMMSARFRHGPRIAVTNQYHPWG